MIHVTSPVRLISACALALSFWGSRLHNADAVPCGTAGDGDICVNTVRSTLPKPSGCPDGITIDQLPKAITGYQARTEIKHVPDVLFCAPPTGRIIHYSGADQGSKDLDQGPLYLIIPGTYTITAQQQDTAVTIKGVAGGGGGGGGRTQGGDVSGGGGGGGGAAHIAGVSVMLQPLPDTYAAQVGGEGSAGVQESAGGAGGATLFSSNLTLNGGAGGGDGGQAVGGSGGSGGSASAGGTNGGNGGAGGIRHPNGSPGADGVTPFSVTGPGGGGGGGGGGDWNNAAGGTGGTGGGSSQQSGAAGGTGNLGATGNTGGTASGSGGNGASGCLILDEAPVCGGGAGGGGGGGGGINLGNGTSYGGGGGGGGASNCPTPPCTAGGGGRGNQGILVIQ